jgi:tetratricopeptide (TPR) repeat protein
MSSPFWSFARIVLSLAAAHASTTSARVCAQDSSAAPKASSAQEEVRQVEIDTSGDQLAAEAFKLDDADPERSVPSMEQAMRSPLKMGYFVMLLIERGKLAEDRGDFPAAIKYRRALVKATPERSMGYSLLCQAYQAAGDAEAALKECRAALGKGGVTVDDNLRFVNLLLAKQGELSKSELEDVEAIIAHLDKELSSDDKPVVLERMRCDLATRLNDENRLTACSTRLRALAPNDPRTFAYAWALALRKHDFKQAKLLIAEAKAVGLPEAAIARMEEGLKIERERAEPWKRWLDQWGLVGGLTLLVLAAGALLTQRRRGALASPVSPG